MTVFIIGAGYTGMNEVDMVSACLELSFHGRDRKWTSKHTHYYK